MRAITSSLSKLGTAHYEYKLLKTCCFDYTYNISSGRIVSEKSPKNGQHLKKFDISENHSLLCEKKRVDTYAERTYAICNFDGTKISEKAGKFSRIFKKFEKRSKNQKFYFSEEDNFV